MLLGALALVILILLPFIRPLAFGVLSGAVLFPLKKKLANSINSWIEKIEKDDTPLIIGLIKLPFSALERLGEFIILFILTHIKVILFGSAFLITLRILLYFLPKQFLSHVILLIQWQHGLFEQVIGSFNSAIVIGILISYVISVYLLWNTSNANLFTTISQLLWIFIIAYSCSFFGPFQMPIFGATMLYGFLGLIMHDSSSDQYFGKFKRMFKKEEEEGASVSADSSHNEHFESKISTSSIPLANSKDILSKTKSSLSEIKSKMQLNVPLKEGKEPKINDAEGLESDWYFKMLFYAVALTILWKQIWILTFCFIPIVFYVIRALCKVLGIGSHIEAQMSGSRDKIKEWLELRKDALLPIFLPGVIQLNKKVHAVFCAKMKSYVDDISSLVMILFLITFVIFISVFSFVQIYSETITVVQLTGDLVNRTLTLRPDLVEMLPINMQSMNDIIDNAYQYSRGTIEEYLDIFLNNTDPQQAVKFKTQVLTVWDRLIQSYMDKYNDHDMVGPRVTSSESLFSSLDEIVTSSGLTFTSVFSYAKNNLSLMREIGDSVWIVLRTNMQLLFTVFTTCFGVLIGSGHFMLSFLFNSVIFFTTLYYLLQSSHERYIPITKNTKSAMQIRLVEALESSVSSVLIATVKLSIFHGLFTYVTHSIFGAHVVYLPAFLASILAAAPFLETYWCAIPAFLDLWLTQNHFYLGLLLVLIHFFIPPSFNVTIHSEIKGGHSYLTALSIAGGIYLLGLEGAIIGPLLLCLLIVLFDVATNSLCSPPTPNTFSSSTINEEIQSPM